MDRRRSARSWFHALTAALALLLLFGAEPARARIFVVNAVGSAGDASPGDGACDTGDVTDVGQGPVKACTLAAAVDEANAFAGPDEIVFDPAIPANQGPSVRIDVLAPLVLTDPVVIDGTNAPGYDGAAAFPAPIVQLDGSSNLSTEGIRIHEDAGGSAIRGLAIYGFPGDGIDVDASDVQIEGCYLGLRDGGTAVAGNGGDGIAISIEVQNVLVGPRFDPQQGFVGKGNVISGNGAYGIESLGENTTIVGNRIGTTPDGTAAELGGTSTGNRYGVWMVGNGAQLGASAFTLDGAAHHAGNLISGNRSTGVELGTTVGRVEENRIGTDASGANALGNGGNGIEGRNASGTLIRENVISGNELDGIALGSGFTATAFQIQGNRIGVAANEAVGIPNGGDGIDGDANSADHEILDNVIGSNGGHGIELRSTDNVVAGNWIGTDPSGADLGNGGAGIHLFGIAHDDYATRNTIGGGGPGAGNVIGHNSRAGVRISGYSVANTIQGNYVGTDAAGRALGNGEEGLSVGSSNTIGGTAPGEGNVIGFNRRDGIFVVGDGNRIRGNWIGTDAEGRDLGNEGDGIEITGNPFTLASAEQNTVGAASNVEDEDLPRYANVIAFNAGRGVFLGLDNFVPPFGGVRANAIRGNRIFANGELGIDLFPVGPNPNDSGDSDTGTNLLQNHPVIDAATLAVDFVARRIVLDYALDTKPAAATYPIVVDFYLADADGQEGRYPIGTHRIPESSAGDRQRVELIVDPDVPLLGAIVATATDSDFLGGNTSEFSPSASLGEPDADADGVADGDDNCRDVPNGPDAPDAGGRVQWDADGDGFGNVCDADFNQDAFVGGPDFDTFLQCFGRDVEPGIGPVDDPSCAEADMNGDGFVGGPDFDLFLRGFGGSPGP